MIAIKYGCIGVRCPNCGKNNIESINRFQFVSGVELNCQYCETPILSIKKRNSTGNLHLHCYACGEIHTYSLSAKSMLSGIPASFNCKENDVEVIYTGGEQSVASSLETLSEELEYLTEKYYENFEKIYGHRSLTALHILEQKAREKRIVCLCGSYETTLRLSDGGIYLDCPLCGSSIFIPIATDEDINALANRRSILIK
ncbi:MAG: hypothetical protein WCX81_01745 [Monoglobales bacterium]